MKEQVNKIVGERATVAVEVRDGRPADVVARTATEANASLIVAGLGRHKVIDRVLGDETALQLVRAANTPVLAVASDFAIPRTTIIGFDFSENSVHAAQLALRFVGRGATDFFLNVAPQENILSAVTGGRPPTKSTAWQCSRISRSNWRSRQACTFSPLSAKAIPGLVGRSAYVAAMSRTTCRRDLP